MRTLFHKRKHGFTLIEIMIVIAILTLLAAIAVPGFVRARKRSQATIVLNEARELDDAKNQYAVDYGQPGTTYVNVEGLKQYLKPQSRLYHADDNRTVKDMFGNAFSITTYDKPVTVNQSTKNLLKDVVDQNFWGAY